jgi:hypothetical protein
VTIFDGSVRGHATRDFGEEIAASGSSTVTIHGGRVSGPWDSISLGERATITIDGGTLEGRVRASDNSAIEMSGGHLTVASTSQATHDCK